MIRVVLPVQLRTLARIDGEVELRVEGQATQRSVLDALEACYPMLRGTIRDHVTRRRRAFVRFFACEQDLSHELPDTPTTRKETFMKYMLMIYEDDSERVEKMDERSFSGDAQMCSLAAGKIGEQGRAAMRLPAPTSGCPACARSRGSDAESARTGNFSR